MQRLTIVFRLFVLLLALYALMRLVFGMTHFPNEFYNVNNILRIFYWGMRLDFAALFYVNAIFLGAFFTIIPLLPPKTQNKTTIVLFSIINLPFIALNLIDLIYFKYNIRRSTMDIFFVLKGSIHSFGTLLEQYWFVLLAFFILSAILIIFTSKILVAKLQPEKKYLNWVILISLLAISVIISRGTGRRPIGPSTPLLYFDPAIQPLVNNSTLNILDSYWRVKTKPQVKRYFSEPRLDSIYSITRQYPQTDSFQKRNVVIFVLESFAADYLDTGTNKAKTPFFDSLQRYSTVCIKAYENGHESTKGLPAVLASIPPFLDEPIYMSDYNSVSFTGIGSLLKKQGYNTSFFLGAEYDHFNFAKLCKMVGIDDYYSKDTYHHPEHDDGNWGIYDEFFFDYFANVVAQKKQPFFSVLFNISSHPPFAIPKEKSELFTIPGQSAQLNSITYVDNCFQNLFKKISREPWYMNTLFIFTADHTIVNSQIEKNQLHKSLRIPIFIYDPKYPQKKEITKIVQQLDIVPSILDKLNYNKPFISFGNSIFRNTEGFSISRINGIYQLIDSTGITGFDEKSDKVVYHFNLDDDLPVSNAGSGTGTSSNTKQTETIKAIIQRFNNSLISHDLRPKASKFPQQR